jgi:hypothetical protein
MAAERLPNGRPTTAERLCLSDLHLLRQSTPFQTGARVKNPDERLGRRKLMAPP